MVAPLPFVCTLATNHALQDLQCFLKSLMIWGSPPVFLFADSAVAAALPAMKYPGKIVVKEELNAYSDKTREEMEQVVVKDKSLWYVFQMEKIRLLEWVFETAVNGPVASDAGVFYLDADICFFGSLPQVPPSYDVALSHHMIRKRDEARYGKYNAGYVWFRTLDAVKAWNNACSTSRFYEQAALEVFDSPEWQGRVHMFPIQVNYGWWRLFQSDTDAELLKSAWRIRRNPAHSGIEVDGEPLLSVHTHWHSKDYIMRMFNGFVRDLLQKIEPCHRPAKRLFLIIKQK